MGPRYQFCSIHRPSSTSPGWWQLPVLAAILYDGQTDSRIRPKSERGRVLQPWRFIIFCPSCKGSFKVRDEYAGKQGVCPKCGHVIRIASSTSETQRGVPRPATRARKKRRADWESSSMSASRTSTSRKRSRRRRRPSRPTMGLKALPERLRRGHEDFDFSAETGNSALASRETMLDRCAHFTIFAHARDALPNLPPVSEFVAVRQSVTCRPSANGSPKLMGNLLPIFPN